MDFTNSNNGKKIRDIITVYNPATGDAEYHDKRPDKYQNYGQNDRPI